jgi:hypothetical protein
MRYITDVDRWISHESRLVKAGQEFDCDFPKGMRLSDTLREVKTNKSGKPESKPDQKPGDDLA